MPHPRRLSLQNPRLDGALREPRSTTGARVSAIATIATACLLVLAMTSAAVGQSGAVGQVSLGDLYLDEALSAPGASVYGPSLLRSGSSMGSVHLVTGHIVTLAPQSKAGVSWTGDGGVEVTAYEGRVSVQGHGESFSLPRDAIAILKPPAEPRALADRRSEAAALAAASATATALALHEGAEDGEADVWYGEEDCDCALVRLCEVRIVREQTVLDLIDVDAADVARYLEEGVDPRRGGYVVAGTRGTSSRCDLADAGLLWGVQPGDDPGVLGGRLRGRSGLGLAAVALGAAGIGYAIGDDEDDDEMDCRVDSASPSDPSKYCDH